MTQKNLSEARRRVALIVGRDTAQMDAEDVARATVESVAENTVDGVIAPLFFAFLGGPVAAMAYKAASTLDSTFGYRNARYRRFGWVSARIDDALNYLPARIGVLLMALAGRTLGEDPRWALKTALRDGPRHASPNAGLAEAAMAGALGIRLGGPVYRYGRLENGPFFGQPVENLSGKHIPRACRLMMGTTLAVPWSSPSSGGCSFFLSFSKRSINPIKIRNRTFLTNVHFMYVRRSQNDYLLYP